MAATTDKPEAAKTAGAKPAHKPSASEIATEAEQAVVAIAKDAATAAAVAGAKNTGSVRDAAAAGAKAGVEAAMADVETLLPPVEHDAWAGLKDWIRKELDLVQAGHSMATRKHLNP